MRMTPAPGPTARILPRGSPHVAVPQGHRFRSGRVLLERGGQHWPHRAPSQDQRDRRDRQRPGFYRQPDGSNLRPYPAAAFRQYRCERRQRHFFRCRQTAHGSAAARGGSRCLLIPAAQPRPLGYTVAANVCASKRTARSPSRGYALRRHCVADGAIGCAAGISRHRDPPRAGRRSMCSLPAPEKCAAAAHTDTGGRLRQVKGANCSRLADGKARTLPVAPVTLILAWRTVGQCWPPRSSKTRPLRNRCPWGTRT